MPYNRITQLPLAVSLDGSEFVPIDQSDGMGGYVTKRTTVGSISAGSDPVTQPVVLAEASGFAPEGRVLTGTSGQISVTDGGAGTTITLALINSGVTAATYGSATAAPQIAVDAKGRITAAANITVTPAIGSITGFGSGVATALAINVGSAGAPVTNGGALGTPSSGTLTSATGLPVSTGISGLGTGVATLLASATGATGTISAIFNGGGSAIPSSSQGDLQVPFACTITAAELLADQSGSIVVDIWKDTYANYPPTIADTITASAKPTISTATKSLDTTLTGWTTTVAAGAILRFNVDSCTSITRCILALTVTKT